MDLNLNSDEFELSMGMSDDFEHAVSILTESITFTCSLTNFSFENRLNVEVQMLEQEVAFLVTDQKKKNEWPKIFIKKLWKILLKFYFKELNLKIVCCRIFL